jgi:hypothetical protein
MPELNRRGVAVKGAILGVELIEVGATGVKTVMSVTLDDR